MLNELKELIKNSIFKVLSTLNYVDGVIIKNSDDIILEIPKDKDHGDYSTNTAMRLAKVARKRPVDIANEIINGLNKEELHLSNVELAGPGFINFTIDKNYILNIALKVNEQEFDYGKSNIGNNTCTIAC